jgi:endogenous inhibitor of DNA gyrase (YacG/DUF329 family)
VGEWREIKRSWHDTALTNCTLCGRLVPRKAWMVEIEAQALPFCNEECEALYRSYWLPKYGKPQPDRADASEAPSTQRGSKI